MKSPGIRLKIISGFMFLIGILLASGAISYSELRKISDSVRAMLDDNYQSIHAAKSMISALEREDSGILLLMLGNWESGRKIVNKNDSLFLDALEICKNNITIKGEEAQTKKIGEAYIAYKTIWNKPIVGTTHQGDLNWYNNLVHKSFEKTRNEVELLMEMNDDELYSSAKYLESRAHRAIMPGIVAVVASIFFTLVFNYFINYYLTKPILRITKGIRNFIKYKMRYNVEIETKDELDQLNQSISNLCHQNDHKS